MFETENKSSLAIWVVDRNEGNKVFIFSEINAHLHVNDLFGLITLACEIFCCFLKFVPVIPLLVFEVDSGVFLFDVVPVPDRCNNLVAVTPYL